MRSPKARRLAVAGAIAAILALPTFAAGATQNVTVAPSNQLQFSPSTVKTSVGAGGVHWTWDTTGTTLAQHNVRQTDKLFYSGTPTNTNPSGFSIDPSAGTFKYYCEVHVSFGMKGVIRVAPVEGTVNPDGSFVVQWASPTTDTGNSYDVRYRVDGGSWKSWRSGTSKTQGTFGQNGKPVTVAAGHTYDIEARSKKAGTTKRSAWSPKLTVTP